MATAFPRDALAAQGPDWLLPGFADIPPALRP
jgi:hypothetical protein